MGIRQPRGEPLRAARSKEAIVWAGRALELAEELGEEEVAVDVLSTIGVNEGNYAKLEENVERAQRGGFDTQVAVAMFLLTAIAVGERKLDLAKRYADEGVAYCTDRGVELIRLYTPRGARSVRALREPLV